MTTWYVRPNASHGGTNAGTSYANAWQGWASIVWGVGGVVGGDTLYVCGAHSSATTLTVGAHGGTSGNEAVLRGDYAGDPGSISITAAGQYFALRSHTNFIDLDVSGVSRTMYTTGSLANVYFLGGTFNGGTNPILELPGDNGTAYSDIRFELCTFNGGAAAAGGGGAVLNWFVAATGAVSTLARVSFRYCTFNDCNMDGTGRAVIHLRTEADADASSTLTDLLLEYNTFDTFVGFAVEAADGHNTVGPWAGVRAIGNTVRNGAETSGSLGGTFSLTGFKHSTTAGFGSNYLARNKVQNVVGRAGGFNLIYGSYAVAFNVVEDLSTTSVDACGVLFDHGCIGCSATSNVFRRLTGKAGTANSGCGIMVLDAPSCVATGNVVDGALTGLFIGDPGSGQSCLIANNTFVNLTDYGIYAGATADLANATVQNNIFTGDGISVRDGTAVSWTGENYNCFHGFSGTSNHTLGAQSFTTDPLLDTSYRPMPESSPGAGDGSPCIGAATYLKSARHMGGKRMSPVSPTIGAHGYYAAREIATDRTKYGPFSPREDYSVLQGDGTTYTASVGAKTRRHDYGGSLPIVRHDGATGIEFAQHSGVTNSARTIEDTYPTGEAGHYERLGPKWRIAYTTGEALTGGTARCQLLSYPLPPGRMTFDMNVQFGDSTDNWTLTTNGTSPALFWQLKPNTGPQPVLQLNVDTDSTNAAKLELYLSYKELSFTGSVTRLVTVRGLDRHVPINVAVDGLFTFGTEGWVELRVNGEVEYRRDNFKTLQTDTDTYYHMHWGLYMWNDTNPATAPTRVTWWARNNVLVPQDVVRDIATVVDVVIQSDRR